MTTGCVSVSERPSDLLIRVGDVDDLV